LSDSELLARLRAGDQDAFDSLFRTHYAQLVAVAERMLGDRGSAEEVVQDVMLELWRRRTSLAVETSLRAYLFRSARNRSLNLIRHERVALRAEPIAAADAPSVPPADREAAEAEIAAALEVAMAALPPRCREVFELSRIHGLRYAEIAAALDISIKTVEAQMGKALRIVREKMALWLPDAEGL
jgi:RNA polymerase sigma-70 factor (ECF subfamily)